MKRYNVTGMSCAACQARVEKAVSKLPGVESVSVSLLTNSMQVEGTASDKEIIKAVKNAGYGAKSAEKKQLNTNDEVGQLQDTETILLKKRLIASVILLIPLMYLTMGHMMLDWPLPKLLAENHVAMGLAQMLITICVLIINQKFFISGFKGIIHMSPNMDTLVAMGAGTAFVYSAYGLFLMTYAQMNADNEAVMERMHDLYFESAAMIVTLITVGKMLESRAKGKTTNALKGLMNLAPKTALVIKDVDGIEKEVNVPIEEISVDDIFVVKPGDSIPVDGVVIEGSSAIDESALTGESIPVDKVIGSKVSSATINQSGYLKCKATRVGEDTTLSQIIKMVRDASVTKAPIAKVADKVSGIFVPVVIAISLVTILVWLFTGQTVGFALARGISVLVISCPCALGLATPVAIMVGNGVGAKCGILFKNATSIENAGKIQYAALDKTGTITKGKPSVTDVVSDDYDDLLKFAYGLEVRSEHPLAKAIVSYAEDKKTDKVDITEFKTETGNGLCGAYHGKKIIAGNMNYVSRFAVISDQYERKADELANEGKTPLFFAIEDKVLGIIAVADVIKDESKEAVLQLKDMGINVIMLTGDNEKTAHTIGLQAGVSEVVAGVLPGDKEQKVSELNMKGMSAMVGDGINDAPALTRADIGIAIGGGTDIAMDAADIVLVKSNLLDVPAAIRLSRRVLRNIYENLFWAFIYNIIGIPIAAGVFYPLFGLKLNPMLGAAAMSLSSFCVVTNALRLNLINIYDKRKDKKRQ